MNRFSILIYLILRKFKYSHPTNKTFYFVNCEHRAIRHGKFRSRENRAATPLAAKWIFETSFPERFPSADARGGQTVLVMQFGRKFPIRGSLPASGCLIKLIRLETLNSHIFNGFSVRWAANYRVIIFWLLFVCNDKGFLFFA